MADPEPSPELDDPEPQPQPRPLIWVKDYLGEKVNVID